MSSPGPWLDARAILEAADLGVPIEWPNELPVDPGEAMWLRVDMVGDSFRPIEMGPTASWSEEGELFVDVLVPKGHGTADARRMAERIAKLFRRLGPRKVVWGRGSIGLGADDENGKASTWWCLPLSLGYRVQDVSTQ
ncbi:phage tail terminator-like protein [Roseomonas sp. USHLN139]|uniref:phage tail terminator-like protein n=1 Tax=Roseomonas sp. USHLN139 TaxID=3081298 RepID=UPI003B01D62B